MRKGRAYFSFCKHRVASRVVCHQSLYRMLGCGHENSWPRWRSFEKLEAKRDKLEAKQKAPQKVPSVATEVLYDAIEGLSR